MAEPTSIYVGREAVKQAEEIAALLRGKTRKLINHCDVTRLAIKQMYEREFGVNEEPAGETAGAMEGENVAE